MEGERERLEPEYNSINKDYKSVFGYKMKVIFGYNKNNDLKMIQLYAGKRGSIVFGHLQTISFLISKLLQYGVSVESIAKRLETYIFDPAGMAAGEKFNSIDHFVAKIMRDYKKKEVNGEIGQVQKPKSEEKDIKG